MAEPFFPLTALSEAQRAQALERFTIIRPAPEEGVSRAQVARASKKAPSTIQLWLKHSQEKGLAGLANNVTRSDKGRSRKLPEPAIQLIEGLALQTPLRSMAAIHRHITTIALEQGWKPPSYDRVRSIIKGLDPALVTMAHQGFESVPMLAWLRPKPEGAWAGTAKAQDQRESRAGSAHVR